MKVLLVVMALGGVLAHAGTIVFDDTADSVFAGSLFNQQVIASFDTGSASGPLSSLELGLGVSNASDGFSVNVALYSNSTTCGTSPVSSNCVGSLIANVGTMADSAITGLLQTVSLTSNPTLAASTRYWIVLTQPTGSADWHYTQGDAGTGVSTEFYGAGSTFVQSNATGGYSYIMQVTLGNSAVPEPGSLGLCAAGLGAMVLAMRRKRRA